MAQVTVEPDGVQGPTDVALKNAALLKVSVTVTFVTGVGPLVIVSVQVPV